MIVTDLTESDERSGIAAVPASRSGRRGSLLLEAAMSAVMLAIAMTLTVKVIGWVATERRACDRRLWAVQEACNVMERLTARPFEDIRPGSVDDVPLSSQAREMLPAAELKVEVAAEGPSGGGASKRVAVQVRWRDRSGGWDSPVRLTSWVYRRGPSS